MFTSLIYYESFICEQAQLKQKEKAMREQKEKLAQLKVVRDLSANEEGHDVPFLRFALCNLCSSRFLFFPNALPSLHAIIFSNSNRQKGKPKRHRQLPQY